MRVLLVEDEPKTAQFITQGLGESGFVVDHAATGTEGLSWALATPYDVVVLDVMVPGLSGWQIIQLLREQNIGTPVLFLTARDTVDDRVRGLELGADDYLIKPFAFSEFLARVRTLTRRQGPQEQQQLGFAGLKMNWVQRVASREGQALGLTAREFTLLWLLLRRKGEVLSRSLIAEKVWDMNFDGDINVIDTAVRRLRRKVDDPFPVPLIHTVRGVGFVLEKRKANSNE